MTQFFENSLRAAVVVVFVMILLNGCSTAGRTQIENDSVKQISICDLDDLELKLAIMSYFKTKSELSGKYQIASISDMQAVASHENQYDIYTEFSYVSVPHNQHYKSYCGTDNRVFHLVLNSNEVKITDMRNPVPSGTLKEQVVYCRDAKKEISLSEYSQIGSNIGAITGKIIFTGNDSDIKGAILGSVVGSLLWMSLYQDIENKQIYEDQLKLYSLFVSEVNEALINYNSQTTEWLDSFNDECTILSDGRKSNKANIKERINKETEIKNFICEVEEFKQKVKNDYVLLNDFYSIAKQSKSSNVQAELSLLEFKINKLKRNIGMLGFNSSNAERLLESLNNF